MWSYAVWLHHCFPGENEGLMQRRKGNRPVWRPASDQVGTENAASDEGGQTQERGLTWHAADGASITRGAADACRSALKNSIYGVQQILDQSNPQAV